MGRPLQKRNFGTNAGAAAGIVVSARKTTTARSSTIVKQRSKNYFKVTNGTDGDFIAKLDQGSSFTANAAGTFVLSGWVVNSGGTSNPSTSGGTQKAIKKITQRRATDYAGVQYKWRLVNDSSADYIELTAL